MSVHPKNWNDGATTDKDWYIHYRFHHPSLTASKPKGHLIICKGMNIHKGMGDRRTVTRGITEDELRKLSAGYNPITGKIEGNETPSCEYLVSPDTGFIRALELARSLHPGEQKTKEGMKTTTVYIERAAISCRLDKVPIKDIRRRHILLLLETCGRQKNVWNNNQFNYYVRNLGMLFKILVRIEATEVNATNGIELRKKTKRVREVLTRTDRKLVDDLVASIPPFRRFVHIFFHSGSRITEVMRIRGRDVQLHNQRFRRTIKKGGEIREVWTTIKDVALPYWKEAIAGCAPDDFVFSRGLIPGIKAIRPEQITRRWKRLVKDKLGIEADFYSLKHLNSTETVELAGDQAAADHNAHTTTAMVVNIYDVAREERTHAKLKKVNNPFV